MVSSLKHIKLRFRKEATYNKPFVAYAENLVLKKVFYLTSYSTIEKRKKLGLSFLEKKISNPSEQFKQFIKYKID
tara:strand:+ start:1135 stop:1359 length:225 start_codon:yes stop_codon:yes gene_type:complete